jgi:sigma-B regulation protein RsbU (phosphoserine phosphatase)
MITPDTKHHDRRDYKRYIEIFYVLIFCVVANIILGLLEISRNSHFSISNLTSWHSWFQYLSIIVAFSIFLLSFYTYYQNTNLRLAIAGFMFLVVGMLDVFSMLSSPEVPGLIYFTLGNPNMYWLLSMLINSAGCLVMVSVPENRKYSVKRRWFLAVSLVVVGAIAAFVASCPSLALHLIDANGFRTAGAAFVFIVALIYAYNIYRATRDFQRGGDYLNKFLACAFIIMFFNQIMILNISDQYDMRILLSHAFKFIAFMLFFNIFYIHGIRRPYVLLSKAKEELNEYTYELDRLVDKRTHELKQVNRRLIADMEVARGIQRSMLPTVLPQNEFVSFVAGYVPAENLSGDFYNVFKIDDTRYGVYIGDVSGHGVSAAMLTIFTFQKIQSLMEETGSEGMSIPSMVLKHLYDSFNAANFSEELYIVLLYGVFNIDTGIFSYASGGLNTSPLRLRPDGSIQELDSEGYAILKLGDILKPKFSNHQIMLFPGDKLVLYTDGLIETLSQSREPYTKERLKELIRKYRKWNAKHLTDKIIEDVTNYADHMNDDITILTIDVLRPF